MIQDDPQGQGHIIFRQALKWNIMVRIQNCAVQPGLSSFVQENTGQHLSHIWLGGEPVGQVAHTHAGFKIRMNGLDAGQAF